MCFQRFSSLANFLLQMEHEKEGRVMLQFSISFDRFALRSLDLDDVVLVVVDKDDVAVVVMEEVGEIELEGAEVELGPEESKLTQPQVHRESRCQDCRQVLLIRMDLELIFYSRLGLFYGYRIRKGGKKLYEQDALRNKSLGEDILFQFLVC